MSDDPLPEWVVFAREGEDLDLPQLLPALTESQRQLLGIVDQRSRALGTTGLPRRRGTVGRCRLCGKEGPLTAEHVPPKAAGNTGLVQALDSFAFRDGIVAPRQAPHQNGISYRVLCAACNNRSVYVNEYAAWAHTIGAYMEAAADEISTATETPSLRVVDLKPVRPGAIIRQALTMLVAVSGSAGLTDQFFMIRRIVVDGAPLPLPEEIHVSLTIISARYSRQSPFFASINKATRAVRLRAELAFPPFAWLLTVGPAPEPEDGLVVSHWTEIAPDAEFSFDGLLPIGFLENPFPSVYTRLGE